MSNSEQQIEQDIQAKGLTAPRITPDNIDSVIVSATYTNLPDGRTIVCQLTLLNGFAVTGESACASIENFDPEIGKKIAYTNAREKIWMLEGYLLKQKLHEQTVSPKIAENIIFVKDYDCHNYYIPSDKLSNFSDWLKSEDYELGDVPDWATRFGGERFVVDILSEI